MSVKINYICHFPAESPTCSQAREFISLMHQDVDIVFSHIEQPPMPQADKPRMPTQDEITSLDSFISQQFEKKISELNGNDTVMTLLSTTNDPISVVNGHRYMPVVGMGYATYWTASSIGDRFAILTPFQGFEQIYRRTLSSYGLESYCHSISTFPHNPFEVRGKLNQDDDLIQNCIELIQSLAKDGIKTIVMGCGSPHVSFNALKLNEVTQQELGVSVLSPLHVGIEMCKSLARSKYPTLPNHP